MRTGIIAAEGEEPEKLAITTELKALSLTRHPIFPSDGESASPVNFAAADEEAALSSEDRQLACLIWDG